MKPTLYLLVGLPASGKSTYAKLLAEEVDGIVVSSDGIRAEWYGDEAIQGDASKIFLEVGRRCYNGLGAGRNVIMDATNMNAKKRANFLKQMPECNKVCVVMAVPFDECIRRDEKRARTVGPAVMEKMRKSFQMPFYNEGWDHIELYYPKDAELTNADRHFGMELHFDQKNSHHTMTVGNHEERAYCEAVNSGYSSIVQWAAAYHDCGKIWCQVTKEGDSDAHYYNHDSVSAYQFLTMDTTGALYDLGGEVSAITAAALITWHMAPYQTKTREEHDKWCEKRGFSKEFSDDLWHLHECDVAAH